MLIFVGITIQPFEIVEETLDEMIKINWAWNKREHTLSPLYLYVKKELTKKQRAR